jgi:hypothetical protein
MIFGSSDNNGKISWDDANADGTTGDNDANCQYFHNCMELKGTVKPTGVTNEVNLDLRRYRWQRAWYKKWAASTWKLDQNSVPWTVDDNPYNLGEDLSPSAADNIYSIDGPGMPFRDITFNMGYAAHIADYNSWALVEIDGTWRQCSEYYKWHSTVYIKPKDANYMTRNWTESQLLGSGWITVPASP